MSCRRAWCGSSRTWPATGIGSMNASSICAAVKPLAIMLCADRVPIVRAHFKSAMTQTGSPDPRIDLVCITSSSPRQFLQNFGTPSSLPGLTSLNRSGFDATSLWHFDAAEQAPSTASWRICLVGLIMGAGVPGIAWLEQSALLLLLAALVLIAVIAPLVWRLLQGHKTSAEPAPRPTHISKAA